MKNYVKKSLALVLMFVTLVSFSNKKGSVSNKKINNPTNLSFENVNKTFKELLNLIGTKSVQ